MRALIVLVAVWSVAPIMVTRGHAQSCANGCVTEIRACLRASRADGRACRVDCRTQESAGGRHSCALGCNADLRDAIKSCRSGLGGCVGTCSAATPDQANCLGGCGRALGECQHAGTPSHGSGRDRVKACLDAAEECRAGCGGASTSTTEPGATTSTTAPVPTTSTTLPGSPSGAFQD